MALKFQDTRPQVLELIPGPDSVKLVVPDAEVIQYVLIDGFYLTICFKSMLEAFPPSAGAAKEEPVGTADLPRQLLRYVVAIDVSAWEILKERRVGGLAGEETNRKAWIALTEENASCTVRRQGR